MLCQTAIDISRRTTLHDIENIFYNVKEKHLVRQNNRNRNNNNNNHDNNNRNGENVDSLAVVLFCELALDILSKVSNTGQLESSFSGVRVVHTKNRNKLAKQRLKKLLYIWWNRRRLKASGIID